MTIDSRLAQGVEAFNSGEYFAAHELWEALWLDEVGTEKLLLQGLVQIAAGYAKAESGVRGGAIKLLTRGLERVRQFGPVALGLTLAPFVDGVSADLQRLRGITEETVSLEQLRVPTAAVGHVAAGFKPADLAPSQTTAGMRVAGTEGGFETRRYTDLRHCGGATRTSVAVSLTVHWTQKVLRP